MIKQCKTSYFIQCDEDIILNENAVEIMYNAIQKTTSNIATLLFHLKDVHSDKIIRGIRICKTDIMKNYLYKDIIASESQQSKDLKKDGYKIEHDKRVLGIHSPYWNLNSIFKRYYNMMERLKQFGGYQDVPNELWNILKENPTKLNLYALFGAFASLFTKKIDKKEKNYKHSYNKQFELINNYFGQEEKIDVNKLEFVSIDRHHPYVKKLKDYLNIEFVDTVEELIQSDKPVIIWNSASHIKLTRHAWKKELLKKCREKGKLVYTFERGALPNTIFLDYNGFLCDSVSYNKNRWNFKLSSKENKQVTKYINDFVSNKNSLEKQEREFISQNQFEKELNISSGITKVFVPLQVKDDTVVLLWSDWVVSLKYFKEIITHISNTMKNVIFLVKNHPNEDIKMLESDNIRIVDNYHYKDCIKYSDVVLTINSSVGLQAMMWQKPVIIVGNAFYQIDSINKKANNIMEIKDLIFKSLKPNKKMIKRFVHYLRFKFYTECNMKAIDKNCSILENITKLRFYTPNGRVDVNTENELQDIKEFTAYVDDTIFEKTIQLLKIKGVEFHLLNESCLDCIRYKSLKTKPKILHIGAKNINYIETILSQDGWVKENENWKKFDYLIYVEFSKQNTKEMKLFSQYVKVPYPVLLYLINKFGQNWKMYNVK